MKQFGIRTTARTQLVNITSEVVDALQQIGGDPTLCHVHVPHTTAAIVVNEAADPDVVRDLAAAYQALVPRIPFAHAEGNSDAHLLASLLSCSVTLPVEDGHLKLGTWQGIFFVELDGPRTRRIWVSAV